MANYVHYAASKGGLKLMMETMSMEYAQYGIRINNISPGAIVTEHTEEKFSDPTTREETIKMIPAREIGNAQDVANAVLFYLQILQVIYTVQHCTLMVA